MIKSNEVRKKEQVKRMESVRAWEGPSLSPSLLRAEGSTAWDPSGNPPPPPPCTFSSAISLSSTITGRIAHC